jgi:hypothetical protein
MTVVKPETVIRWHRRGFRAYWPWKSRRLGDMGRSGRPTSQGWKTFLHNHAAGIVCVAKY